MTRNRKDPDQKLNMHLNLWFNRRKQYKKINVQINPDPVLLIKIRIKNITSQKLEVEHLKSRVKLKAQLLLTRAWLSNLRMRKMAYFWLLVMARSFLLGLALNVLLIDLLSIHIHQLFQQHITKSMLRKSQAELIIKKLSILRRNQSPEYIMTLMEILLILWISRPQSLT